MTSFVGEGIRKCAEGGNEKSVISMLVSTSRSKDLSLRSLQP